MMRDAVLDAAPDGVITIDERGAIVEFNSAAERIFGVARSDALGRRAADLVIPEPQRAAHTAGLRRLVAGGESRLTGRRVRLCAQRADGREIMVECEVTRTSDVPPRFTAWIRELSGRDVDAAGADDRPALREAGEQLHCVGSWEWTPSRSKLVWSDTVYGILGLQPGDVTPEPQIIVDVTHPADRARVRANQEELKAGRGLAPVTYRVVRPDGEVRHLRTTVAVAELRGDKPYRFVGYTEDLTHRIRAGRSIAARTAVAQATTAWASFEHGAQELLGGLGAALHCQGAIIWLPRTGHLVARAVWRDASMDAALLGAIQRGARARGGGLARSARTGHEVACEPCAVAIPAVFKEVLAVLELRSRDRLDLTEPLIRALTTIGRELGRFFGERRHELDVVQVTPRELEVLALAANGHSAHDIADHLVISVGTVKTHFQNVYPKLGVADRAAAVATALRLGLID